MNTLSEQQAETKWGGIIKSAFPNIPAEHMGKICVFAHTTAIKESEKHTTTPAVNFHYNPYDDIKPEIQILPISLRIISKIQDLSKVEFITQPHSEIKSWVTEIDSIGNKFLKRNTKIITTDTYKGAIITEKPPKYGLDDYNKWANHVEEEISNIVSSEINKAIDEGDTIYLYEPCSTIYFIDRGPNYEICINWRLKKYNENALKIEDI